MKQASVNILPLLPINRESAARIATAASRYQSTFTMEHGNSVINLKSMLGLLSQSFPKDGKVILTADGPDEEDAIEELTKVLPKDVSC